MTQMRGIAENYPATDAIVPPPGAVADIAETPRNRLLRSLPAAELRRVLALCEQVEIRPRQILHFRLGRAVIVLTHFVPLGVSAVSKIATEKSFSVP